MRKISLSVVKTFSDKEKQYLIDRFSKICNPAMRGDEKLFDEMCTKIPAFCEEIYQIGKDMVWPPIENPLLREVLKKDIENPFQASPNDRVIGSVGSNIGAHILPLYKSYATKSEALHKMICDILATKKYGGGRSLFITQVWTKTKRTDGIDIPDLLHSDYVGVDVVATLLKFRDGRFAKEVRELQSRLTKYHSIFYRKKVALYLERYG